VQRHVHRPLRFRSQVLSTSQRFPGRSGLGGLVSCRRRPWGSPFRALLLAGIACASRRRLLPCSSPPPYLRCDTRDRILRVSPTPTPCGAVAWIPTGARTPFPSRGHARSRARACRDFPGTLGLTHRTHLVPATSSASKLCSPRESVLGARRFRGHAPAVALMGLRLSRALIRSSLGPLHDPVDRSVHRGLVSAGAKGATLRHQVKPGRPHGHHDLVGGRSAGRLRTEPCRLSAAVLPP
jgi:hypothetical protein